MLPHFIFYITQMWITYTFEKRCPFYQFLPSGHFRHGPDEYGPGGECRHVGLPVSAVICAPCGHCCERHVVAQAAYRYYTAFPCPASKEWARCLSVNCQQTPCKTTWDMQQKTLCSPSGGRLTRTQALLCPMLWGSPGLWPPEDLKK